MTKPNQAQENNWREDFQDKFLTQDGRGWIFKNNIIAKGEDAKFDVEAFISDLLKEKDMEIANLREQLMLSKMSEAEKQRYFHKEIIQPLPTKG